MKPTQLVEVSETVYRRTVDNFSPQYGGTRPVLRILVRTRDPVVGTVFPLPTTSLLRKVSRHCINRFPPTLLHAGRHPVAVRQSRYCSQRPSTLFACPSSIKVHPPTDGTPLVCHLTPHPALHHQDIATPLPPSNRPPSSLDFRKPRLCLLQPYQLNYPR